MRWLAPSARFLLPAIALCAILSASGQKKPPYYVKKDQMAGLTDPKLVTAKQSCENWGLAAGLETMLAQQKVALDQNFWVMRLNYGETCVEHLPDIELLAKIINQEFVLDDGRHVRLELHFEPGAPSNIDALLGRLKRERSSLLLWRGHPYYLVAATYDEHIRSSDGRRIFEIKELRLVDTFAQQPAATFQRGRDNPGEIEGVLTVEVVPL